jgi:hypothetical protein
MMDAASASEAASPSANSQRWDFLSPIAPFQSVDLRLGAIKNPSARQTGHAVMDGIDRNGCKKPDSPPSLPDRPKPRLRRCGSGSQTPSCPESSAYGVQERLGR